MNRPYIFCHRMTSLDGKIMGKYMDLPESELAGTAFYNIAFGPQPHYQHQGWLSGRLSGRLTQRLAAYKTQTELAASTDFPTGQTPNHPVYSIT